jgi:hypothetical protein
MPFIILGLMASGRKKNSCLQIPQSNIIQQETKITHVLYFLSPSSTECMLLTETCDKGLLHLTKIIKNEG